MKEGSPRMRGEWRGWRETRWCREGRADAGGNNAGYVLKNGIFANVVAFKVI